MGVNTMWKESRGYSVRGVFILAFIVLQSVQLFGQDTPPQRQIRTFIPPDQIVSFVPTTTFTEFINTLNPIFVQVLGKRVIDPESRTFQINLSIVSMHFFDAFELVLDLHTLTYRETDQYFIIETAPDPTIFVEDAQQQEAAVEEDVSVNSRDILIEAVLFEVNLSKSRELGLDWRVFLSNQSQGGGQGSQGGSRADEERPRFFVKTDEFFAPYDDWLVSPDVIDASVLAGFFRTFENEGTGETVANPSVVVSSGERGNIQIGQDIPVQVRDFAGNTITQFVQTGIIINVTPTLVTDALADTAGAPTLDFLKLDIQVERSAGRPFGASGIAIDRSKATTNILLLHDEMTIIGGLYSTEESQTRRGIPILKDLPPWVLGLRYIFGFEQTTTIQRELLIVLRARLIDSLPVRAERALSRDLINEARKRALETFERFDEGEAEKFPFPPRVEENESNQNPNEQQE